MASITPPLLAQGFFTVRAPYSVNAALLYEVIAIRSFSDIFKKNEDVYTVYYKRYGLTDGQNGFVFQNEVKAGANIITLLGKDGSYVYVPDTFITKYPDTTATPYRHVILSVSLGPLPDTFDTTTLVAQLQSLAAGVTGVSNPVVNIALAPVLSNPTATQAAQMEQTRLGNISINQTPQQLADQYAQTNSDLTNQNQLYTEMLQVLGGLPL